MWFWPRRPPAAPVVFDGVALEETLASMMDGHVSYNLGDKCKHSQEPEDIRSVDCSGFIEYVFYRITTPHVDVPSGSANQKDWFKARYAPVDYSEASRRDGFLRIAFRRRTAARVGHVWFTINGRTLESTTKSNNNGPSSLSWDERRDEASECMLLGLVLPPRFDTDWIP